MGRPTLGDMESLGSRRLAALAALAGEPFEEFDPESLEGRIWTRWNRALDQLEAGEFLTYADRGVVAGDAVRMSLAQAAKMAADEARLGF